MVFIKRKAKYLNRKILNTYMAYPLIIQKKAMQILNVNMGIIFMSTLFLVFKMMSIDKSADDIAQIFMVVSLSAFSIRLVFHEEPEKAVYVLFASMMSIFLKDIAAGVLNTQDFAKI